ncbi:dioxygenase family protein [Alicyclobacillus fastidiosus]|uniref:Class III extradiol ring-cleavage dioxygenase n=1 Tax=Alicyclobacillus fastidiosus TaxID=392011 RepID=A0ABV5ACL3_9BACL|nr:class III extradiol ring-cleavage dioxygenase [Alicyclobacillus fastidiosus]WEH11368.1 class III extradiol ring-cleavage dioxygenase [Alicyclobacillus fastidiosus]
MMPSLFVAHGAPLLAIEDNEYTQFLTQLGRRLPRPKAVVVFSAHWVTGTQKVSEVNEYETVHDFGGFPDALYQIRYPARGDRQLARDIESLLTEGGIPFEVEADRGLDHGAWVVLRLLYPNADVPVVAMSVNPRVSPAEQYKIGQSLAQLRQRDILVIASGGTVHNLWAVNWQEDGIDDWALQFDQWLEHRLLQWDLTSLYRYDSVAPSANLAVPPHGNEHFVPIFYAMGAADDVRTARLLHRSYRYGNLSHSVWQFG